MAPPDLEQTIKQALAANPPAGVVRVLVHSGMDSTGGAAVWIYVILQDDAPSRETLDQLSHWAASAVSHHSESVWPYVAFRTKSEQDEIDDASISRE